MNNEKAVVLVKGVCMVTMPTVAALGAGVAALNKPTIFWLPTNEFILVCSTYGVFAGAVLAWLSKSASELLRNGNGGAVPPEGTKP